MVERITDPHKPVQVHGVGRLADGDTVPQPPATFPAQRYRRLRRTVLACLAVVALGVLVGVLR